LDGRSTEYAAVLSPVLADVEHIGVQVVEVLAALEVDFVLESGGIVQQASK
jgi:hypothetical protein